MRKSIMKNILRAKDFGYEIDMYYVGLNDVELAKKRVHYRVEHGGHGISDEDIERRYYESLDNLKKTIPLCDKVFIYDNSVFFRWIAMYRNGQREWASKDKPVWIEDLEDYFTKGKNE
ncbi:MAG: hypothetical protein K5659_06685 [Lachnospiraceae bacterium]|nr:hypothetical protein [Lachnospiraceae bacterium]